MRYRLVNERTGQAIASDVALCDKPWSRGIGLLGRRGLPEGAAIVLRPGSSIHTMFMMFSLDIVYLDREGVVLKVVRNLKPFRFSACRGARDTVELQAGALDRADLQEGDRLKLESIAR